MPPFKVLLGPYPADPFVGRVQNAMRLLERPPVDWADCGIVACCRKPAALTALQADASAEIPE